MVCRIETSIRSATRQWLVPFRIEKRICSGLNHQEQTSRARLIGGLRAHDDERLSRNPKSHRRWWARSPPPVESRATVSVRAAARRRRRRMRRLFTRRILRSIQRHATDSGPREGLDRYPQSRATTCSLSGPPDGHRHPFVHESDSGHDFSDVRVHSIRRPPNRRRAITLMLIQWPERRLRRRPVCSGYKSWEDILLALNLAHTIQQRGYKVCERPSLTDGCGRAL